MGSWEIGPLDLIILEGGDFMLFAPHSYVFSWQCYYTQYKLSMTYLRWYIFWEEVSIYTVYCALFPKSHEMWVKPRSCDICVYKQLGNFVTNFQKFLSHITSTWNLDEVSGWNIFPFWCGFFSVQKIWQGSLNLDLVSFLCSLPVQECYKVAYYIEVSISRKSKFAFTVAGSLTGFRVRERIDCQDQSCKKFFLDG